MATYVYDDFRVTFAPRADGAFDARATDAAGTSTAGTFVMPLDDDELTRAVLQVARSNSRKAAPSTVTAPSETPPPSARPTRDVGANGPPALDAEHLGALLAGALLAGDVGAAYDAAKHAAEAKGSGLRLSLSLAAAPALVNVPWEFLYRRPRFLASQRHTPLVRWLDTGTLAPPPTIEQTVRILGVIASPRDLNPLDVTAERQRVENAVAKMRDLGRVELDWLEPATPRRLRETLRDGSYHVLHYVGHSDYTTTGEGVLFLENANGAATEVDSTALANLLSDQNRLRLVVLNSCEGARTSLHDPYAGVATTLIQLGVPAVVAMQFEISDEAAILFAEELYTNLIGRQDPIDAAVAEARKAIFIEIDKVEWATPVLFVRDPDVELFSFEVEAAPLPPPPPPMPLLPQSPGDGDGDDDGDGQDVGGQQLADSGGAGETAPPTAHRFGTRSRLIAAAVGAAVALAGVVIGIAVLDGDDDGSTTQDSSVVTQRGRRAGLDPRPHTGAFAAQVARSTGEVHLFTVEPNTGAVGVASNNADARDREPDWDPATNRLAFARDDASVGRCVGLCYVVPGNFRGELGKQVAQLVPVDPNGRQHAPAWARDGTLYYALDGLCAQGSPCGEIHRVTFTAGDDGSGFADALEPSADALVIGGLADVRDLDADPQDEERIAVADADGVTLVRGAGAEGRLDASEGTRQIVYAPDGNRIVGLGDDGGLRFWERSGAELEPSTIAELLTDLAARGGSTGALDPRRAEVLSISPDVADSDVIVLVGAAQGVQQIPPHVALLRFGGGGPPALVEVRALPAELLREGSVVAIAR